ncbi:MAG: hypothetical protein ACI8P0_003002 [Planctomycetaceae bacterium]
MELPEAADVLIAASQKRVDVAEAHAEYDQINRDMGEAIVGPDAMAKWITENIGHPKELEARNAMIFGYLNVTRRAGPPDEDGELSAADLKALAAAAELVPKLKAANEVSTLVHGLGNHFKNHYFERGAKAACIDGLQRLVPLEVPVNRANLMITVLDLQRQLALSDLKVAVAAGLVPDQTAPMPASLKAAADTADLINKEYPDKPVWAVQAEIANHILDHTAAVPWPTKITSPKAAHTWALSFASRVIAANADPKSLKSARDAVDRVLADLLAMTQPSAQGLASRMQGFLLLEIAPDSSIRTDELLKHVDLLMADAARAFNANVKSGESTKNSKLSETQTTILKELAEAVQLRPSVVFDRNRMLDCWPLCGRSWIVRLSRWPCFATKLCGHAQLRGHRQASLAALRRPKVNKIRRLRWRSFRPRSWSGNRKCSTLFMQPCRQFLRGTRNRRRLTRLATKSSSS